MLAVGPRLLGWLTDSSWFGIIIFGIMCWVLIRTALKKMDS
jgi:hypothetical protein